MPFLITLQHGQIPIEVAGLHLVPGKAVPVDEVPEEVKALRPRVRLEIKTVRGLRAPAEDGPEREAAPDLGDDAPEAVEPVEAVEPPAKAGKAGKRTG